MRGESLASRPESFVLSFVKVKTSRGRARRWGRASGHPGPETTRVRHVGVLQYSADVMMVRSLYSGGKMGNVGLGNVATLLTETTS